MAGITHPGSRAHAPDENIRLADYFEGIHFIRRLIEAFA
jgi:acetylornithine deacetylase/succinyl-diaminopimelate desuccinylase-like protein